MNAADTVPQLPREIAPGVFWTTPATPADPIMRGIAVADLASKRCAWPVQSVRRRVSTIERRLEKSCALKTRLAHEKPEKLPSAGSDAAYARCNGSNRWKQPKLPSCTEQSIGVES